MERSVQRSINWKDINIKNMITNVKSDMESKLI